MNVVADESVDRQIVEQLRHDGHQVTYVAEIDPGISDDAVLDLANQERSLLLTADKDFGELVFRQHALMSGVVLARLAGVAPLEKAALISAVFREHGAVLYGVFTVVTPGRMRVRQQHGR